MKYVKYISSPIGKIGILEENGFIIALDIVKEIKKDAIEQDTKLLGETEKQLKEYFEGKRKEFTIPYHLEGTEFMKKVWKALTNIPYGQVKTYAEIAKEIGNPKAARAVGMANHNNPIAIIVPCHRVIGSSGKLVGYALGLDKKEYLLNLEKEE